MTKATYSLGYNFDFLLLDRLIELNEQFRDSGRISEVFGAIQSGCVPSARPRSALPLISWTDLRTHVQKLRRANIDLNYLLNAAQHADRPSTLDNLKRISDAGIRHITTNSSLVAELAKTEIPGVKVTASLTMNISREEQLARLDAKTWDNIYLSATEVNRDIAKLKQLIRASDLNVRLYANVSCLSGCPVVQQHYGVFSTTNPKSSQKSNDRYFDACTTIKARDPYNWLQMPWIRPEDIGHYCSLGVSHFKLSDRLASTSVLSKIANAYLSGASPPNLFEIIERQGHKFARAFPGVAPSMEFWVDSARLDDGFIDHFFAGACDSKRTDCPVCDKYTREAVTRWLNTPTNPHVGAGEKIRKHMDTIRKYR